MEKEVKAAVWNYVVDKALGPNGFTFAFLKAHWETIKGDILGFIKEFNAREGWSRGETLHSCL